MGAFIISAVVEVVTILICLVMAFANGMSDAPSQSGISIWPTFIGGTFLAAAILGSHWLPHIGW